MCCGPWGDKESDTAERLDWTGLKSLFGAVLGFVAAQSLFSLWCSGFSSWGHLLLWSVDSTMLQQLRTGCHM